jgi:septal ring factor EnvC (AmiA/AmiB activator)
MEHSNFKEVAEMMHDVNADVSARSIAEAHDKYLHDLASLKACMERAAKERQETQKELDEAQKELDQVQKELDQTQKENDRLLKIIADAGLSPDGK